VLETRNLEVRYGDTVAVHDVSLRLDRGEILTLVGPTGCGKTSVLRAVAGLVPPAGGEIRIGELRVDHRHDVPPERRRTGLVFQDFALFPHLSVERNIGFRVADDEAVNRWIARLGLERHRHAMPEALSGGQKQRVALARALAHAPALVLLDEPLSNLDATLKAELRWEIRDALKAAGVPALWVTHDQTEALSVGDRVGVMHAGRLEQTDTPEVCFRGPATRFVAGFLGEAAFLPGRARGSYAETALGPAPAACTDGGEPLDVLVRPDDVALAPAREGNAEIVWARYEGESRLYGVRLHDGGGELRVRTNHELELSPGQAVRARIVSSHPLALFPRGDDALPQSRAAPKAVAL